MDENAHILRPVRVDEKNNGFINYTGTTFPKNPRQGCELTIRRLRVFGYISKEYTGLILDVLDKDETILDDFHLTKAGFEYLRKKFKFVREDQS